MFLAMSSAGVEIGIEGARSFAEPRSKPEWPGEVGSGRVGEGTLLQAGLPG